MIIINDACLEMGANMIVHNARTLRKSTTAIPSTSLYVCLPEGCW